ncbi:hypothetical protein BLOT_010192 [Blomia tropicalis]|nr:hypothetical protein BLOT_010192 [Blomia tropicalis]
MYHQLFEKSIATSTSTSSTSSSAAADHFMDSNNSNSTNNGKKDIFPQFFEKIKVDSQLVYPVDLFEFEIKKENRFKRYLKCVLDQQKKERSISDPLKRVGCYPFPYHLCMIASKLYDNYDEGEKAKYEEGLPNGWRLLTIATNPSNGYVGAAFWYPQREEVIIAHRGIEPTTLELVWADFKNILIDEFPSQTSSAVTFSEHVWRVFNEIDAECDTHFQLFITGHSFGGWLAQICTFSVKYLTMLNDKTEFVESEKEGYHARTIVFDSPGCESMLLKMQKSYDITCENVNKQPIYSLDITSYLSAPNLINTCNTHLGKVYQMFIDETISYNQSVLENFKTVMEVFNDNFKSLPNEIFDYTLKFHNLNNILKTFDSITGLIKKDNSGKFKIQDVVDWPSNKRIKKEEFYEFFKWIEQFNEYHPLTKNVEFENNSINLIRYQTKKFNERQCSLNVFSQSDQLFMKQYQLLQKYPKFFNLNTLFNDEILNNLKKISLMENANIVEFTNGSIVELYNTISYIKRLLIICPEKVDRVKNWLSNEGIVEAFYKHASDEYLNLNNRWLKFKTSENIDKMLIQFLNEPNQIVWKIDVTTGDTYCVLNQIYDSILRIRNNKIDSGYLDNYVILDLKQLLSANCLIKVEDFFKSKQNGNLLIVEYNLKKVCNEMKDNSDSIKMFFTNLFIKLKTFQMSKVIVCANQAYPFSDLSLNECLNQIQYIKTNDAGFGWNDLDERTQKELLHKEIVFQEKEKKLLELFDEFNIVKEEIDQLLNFDSLIKLIIYENKIEIGSNEFGIGSLEGAFADLFEEINIKTLKLYLNNNSLDAIYFLSGLFTDDEDKGIEELKMILNFEIDNIDNKTYFLKFPYSLQTDTKKIYLVDTQFMEENFNKLCNRSSKNQKMYWIRWDTTKFILQRIFNPDFYIKRKFNKVDKVTIKKDIKILKNQDNFVFNGIDSVNDLLTLFNNSKMINGNIFIKQTIEDAQTSFNEINGNVHWVEIETIENVKQIVLRESKGSLHNIRPYIENENSLHDEVSLINFINDKQTIIIAGEPGMGKSTTLIKLYQSKLDNNNTKLVESNWIIHVNLRDQIQTIKSFFNDNSYNIDNIVEFFSKIEFKLSSDFSKKLFKQALLRKDYIHKPLLISFDGFDELLDFNDRDKIIKLLKFLKDNTKVKIWVTTCAHYCNVLEDVLSTFAITINPLDEKSIKMFTAEYLKTRLNLILNNLENRIYKHFFAIIKENENKLINDFAKIFFNRLESLFKGNISGILGTPLQIYLLLGAKGFIKKFIRWVNNTNSSFNFDCLGKDIVSVYENFIDNKYDIYVKKVCINNLHDDSDCEPKENFNRYCLEFAEKKLIEFDSCQQFLLELNQNFYLNGIIKRDKQNIKFIHQTFEEYYFSETCISWITQTVDIEINAIKKIETMLHIFKDDNYKAVRLFIDVKLRRIKESKQNISDLIYEQFGIVINKNLNLNNMNMLINQQKFTILDIAIKENNWNIADFLINSMESVETNLIKKFICCKPNNFPESILHIAVMNGNVEIVKNLIELFDRDNNVLIEIINNKNKFGYSSLHIAVEKANVEIFETLISPLNGDCHNLFKVFKDENKDGNLALHLAVNCDKVKIIEKCIDLVCMNKNYLFEMVTHKNGLGNTPLHIAVNYGNLTIVEKLIEIFDNNPNELIKLVTDRNQVGYSSLISAVQNNNNKIVETLITLFCCDKKSLIQVINSKNAFGSSSLHIAIEKDNVEIFETLTAPFVGDIDSLIDLVKDKSLAGDTILHIAVKNRNVEIVKKILELFGDNEDCLIKLIHYNDKNLLFQKPINTDLNAVETNESDIFPPYCEKIKVDLELRYPKDLFELNFDESKNELKQYLKNVLEQRTPKDPLDREAIHPLPYHLCMIASKVYQNYNSKEKEKYELNEEGFPSGWELLTIASNPSLSNGYFGAAFWHPEREQVIIAHRGTEPTNVGSLWTDFKSVLKNDVSSQINSAVTFTHHVKQVFADIDSEGKTHFQMFITGHSLGAWLAQVCTFSMKYLTIVDEQKYFGKSEEEGYHAHTVVFDSPGCKPMLLQMKDWYDVRNDNVENLPINSLDITSYLSAPNLVNTCNTHVGKIYRVFIDFLHKSSFTDFFYDPQTHSIINILETFDKITGLFQTNKLGNYKLYEVIDWPGNTGIIKKEEYDEFFKWAKKFIDYHLTCKNIQFKDYYPIRYQTKPFDEKQCSLNVFTQSEQLFLKQYQLIQAFPDFFKLDTLFSNKDIVNKLNKISINENENIVSICDGTFEELHNTIFYIKRLLIFQLGFVEKIKSFGSVDGVVKEAYKHVSDNYLEINNKKWLKFKKCKNTNEMLIDFLNDSNQNVWKINVDGDTFCTLVKIYNLVTEINNESFSGYVKNCAILDLSNLLLINRLIKMQNFLKLEENKKLFIVEYNFKKINKDNESIKKFFTDLFQELKTVQSCKIILCAKHDFSLKNTLHENLDEYKETDDEGFTWDDLSEVTQKVLLNREIVFHEQEKKLSDLVLEFNIENHEIVKFFDFHLLIKLINNENKFKIGDKPYGIDKLEGAYVDLFEEVNHETLKSNLSNNSIETVFFISGLFIDENEKIKISNILNFNIEHKVNYLKFPYSLQSEIKNIYLVDELFNENNFNNLCIEHSNKIMYWINWDKAKFNLQKIFNSNFYIERNFKKILIKKDIKMFQNPDSFVFIGLNNFNNLSCLFDYKNYSSLLTKNIYLKKNANNAIEIFNKRNGNVHLMEIETFEDKKQIVWRNSKGSIENIRQYIDSSDDSDFSFKNEDSLVDSIKDKQTIIIADDPGKGKSTTLIKLYQSTLKSNNKKLFESNWIIHVNLRNNIQTIKTFLDTGSFDVDSFVQFLSKFNNNLSNKFSQKLLKNALLKKDIHKPLLISFDSFDELHNSINRDKFIEFLKIFKNKTKIKIWITTRTHCSEVLENALSTFAITFSPMNKESITSFIFNYLKIRLSLILNYEIYDTIFVKENTNNKLINDFIENFLIKVNSIFVGDISRFIGSPLTLHLLLGVKGFINEFKKWVNNNTNSSLIFEHMEIDIVSVYENFINNKFDIYFKKINLFNEEAKLELREKLNDYCVKLAENSFLNFKSYQQPLEKVNEIVLSFGIFELKENNVKFIHQTFGEFFASKICLSWITQNTETKSNQILEFILKNDNYITIRLFINIMLAKFFQNEKLSDEFYKQYKKVINEKWNNNSEQLMDQDGFTILDIAIKEGNLNIVYLLLNILKTENNIMIKKFVLSKKNKFKMNSLQIALIQEFFQFGKKQFNLVNKLTENTIPKQLLENLSSAKYPIMIFEKLIELFHNEKFFLFEILKDENIQEYSGFKLVIYLKNLHFLKKLIAHFDDKNLLVELVKDKDKNGVSALHFAAIENNVEMVEMLLAVFNGDKDALIEFVKDKDKDECSALHHAANKNNVEIVEKLIAVFNGDKVALMEFFKEKDKDGWSALHHAANQNNVEIVEKLIAVFNGDKDVLIEFVKDKDKNERSALHHAANQNNVKIVEKLIAVFNHDKDALIEFVKDKDNDECSALHHAANQNNVEIVEKLIAVFNGDKDVLIEFVKDKDKNERSALHHAANQNNVKIVEKLIAVFNHDKDALIEFVKDKDNDECSALHYAANKNYVEIVEKLIAVFNGDKVALMEFFIDKDKNECSALHHAANKNYVEIVEKLIAVFNGDKVALMEFFIDKDKNECSALHHAANKNNVEIVEKLIAVFNGDKDVLIEFVKDKDKNERSALHHAANQNNVKIVEKLIAVFNGDKDVLIEFFKEKDKDECSALHHAANQNNVKIVEKLIAVFNHDKDALIEFVKDKDNDECSALHYAANKNYVEIVEKLIAVFNGDKVALMEFFIDKDKNECSALHHAANKNNVEIVEKLIAVFNGDKDVLIEFVKDKDKDGWSALHHAANKNNVEIVEKLIAVFNGDKVALIEFVKDKDKNERSALHHAVNQNNVKIVEKLIAVFNGDKVALMEFFKEKDKDECSALHYAANQNNVEIVEKLIAVFNGDKDVLIEFVKDKDKNERSALHHAANQNNVKIVEKLIAVFNGDKVALMEFFIDKDKNECSALHHAANKNNVEIVEKLIAVFNGDKDVLIEFVKDKDKDGWSALHHAANKNNVEIVEKLIAVFNGDKVALIEFVKDKDKNERSALHHAANQNNVKIVEKLIAVFNGDKVALMEFFKEKDKYGWSALHIIASENNVEMGEKLIAVFNGDKDALIEFVKDM